MSQDNQLFAVQDGINLTKSERNWLQITSIIMITGFIFKLKNVSERFLLLSVGKALLKNCIKRCHSIFFLITVFYNLSWDLTWNPHEQNN